MASLEQRVRQLEREIAEHERTIAAQHTRVGVTPIARRTRNFITEVCSGFACAPLGDILECPACSQAPDEFHFLQNELECCPGAGGFHTLKITSPSSNCQWQTDPFDCPDGATGRWVLRLNLAEPELALVGVPGVELKYRKYSEFCCICENQLELACGIEGCDAAGISPGVCVSPVNIEGCTPCEAIPNSYQVDLRDSIVATGSCSDVLCASLGLSNLGFRGDFDIPHETIPPGGLCHWLTRYRIVCTGGVISPEMYLRFNQTLQEVEFILVPLANASTWAIWSIPFPDFNCLSRTVLTLRESTLSTTHPCIDPAPTVTVEALI